MSRTLVQYTLRQGFRYPRHRTRRPPIGATGLPRPAGALSLPKELAGHWRVCVHTNIIAPSGVFAEWRRGVPGRRTAQVGQDAAARTGDATTGLARISRRRQEYPRPRHHHDGTCLISKTTSLDRCAHRTGDYKSAFKELQLIALLQLFSHGVGSTCFRPWSPDESRRHRVLLCASTWV